MNDEHFMQKNKLYSRMMAIILFVGFVTLQIISQAKMSGEWSFLASLLSEWLMLLAIFLLVQLRMKKGLASIGFVKANKLRNYGLGMSLGSSAFLLFLHLATISGAYGWQGLYQPINWGIVLLFAAAFIGQSALEEVVFRGLLLHLIAKRRSKFLAILGSSLVFSLLHMPKNGAGNLTFLNIFLMAALFSLLVLLTGSLYISCGLHFAWNYLQMVIFNTPNSQDRITSGIFHTSYLSSNPYLTGGTYGPEASVFTTLIVSLAILLILVLYGKKMRLKESLL